MAPVLFYRTLLSPLLPRSCIYHPTCSKYAQGALSRFGALRGGTMAVLRIGRCVGGLFRGGDDPVPGRWSWHGEVRNYRRRFLPPYRRQSDRVAQRHK